ncbi:MAG: hypothetical protein P0Y59_14260 [Candidatus Sphingomonas phytovorans]|nr:hypothetical protein [Sphingomonas sp.]WEJ98114.1 MAG: hypothetical protein P0Y59_14260 [Sphingomonas sp.]
MSDPVSTTIFGPNQFVTGVRGWTGSDVILTGTTNSDGATTALLYLGPLTPTDGNGLYSSPPVFPGQSVTGSTLYGPDTFVFNPALGDGNVRAVGNYQYSGSAAHSNGMMYQGPPQGGGTWSQIDVPSSLVGGQAVWNTIPHSTMGDLVVGDYDLKGVPLSANAFLYDIAKDRWTIFDIPGCTLTTAYGIWQHGIGSSSYTIVGGTRNGHGINQGMVIGYDSATGAFSNLKLYSYLDQPALVTHFEGIVATPTGFNLAGGASGSSALLASISINPDGAYSDATWIPYAYPGAALTTGNSIYRNALMGIFAISGTPGVQSYVATFPL